MNISGRTTIKCTVTASGSLTDCSVTAETPPDYGFGDAALKLTRLFKVRPSSVRFVARGVFAS